MYPFSVFRAIESGNFASYRSITLNIVIKDVNDNNPTLTGPCTPVYIGTIREDVDIGKELQSCIFAL